MTENNQQNIKNPFSDFKKSKEFEEKIIEVNRITRVVKGGRKLRFRAAVVVGNKNGRVGFAVAKASEVQKAVQKASLQAKKQMIDTPINKNQSIPHDVEVKFVATSVMLKPAPSGTSLIAGSSVRSILEIAGYQNVISKVHGSTNKVNTGYATILCLKQLKKTDD